MRSLTKSAITANRRTPQYVYPNMWGNLSLCDQKLKSSTFGKHCTISKGSSNREKSRSRCLRLLVGMLNFSLMMEYFIPLASTLKEAVCSFGNRVKAISPASRRRLVKLAYSDLLQHGAVSFRYTCLKIYII